MAQANSEQKIAIEHSGGVLLKAGAGSGKTFVLIHHIEYLLNKCLFDFEGNLITRDEDLIKQNLKKELSRIVLMTFTKKAAGELAIRLNKKIKDKIENWQDDSFNPWLVVKESISYLTVSTIDGFCYKLLKEGFVSEFPMEVDILLDMELNLKISNLFDLWFDNNQNKLDSKLKNILIFNKKELLNSILKIFKNPELRLLWKKPEENTEEFSFEKVINQTMKFEGIGEFFDNIPSSGEYTEFSKTKWFLFLQEFEKIAPSRIRSFEDLKNVKEYLATIKRLPTKPKEETGLFEVIHFFEQIKLVKKFLKDNYLQYEQFVEHEETAVRPWMETLVDIVDFIDANYLNSNGVSFSDLEYYVLLAVQKKEIAKKIFETYNYFIIDEFQDTSFVQFEIIERIIDFNYDHVFCVGDIKQAIYGFKGGEIKVFQQCQKNVPKDLDLSNNYRSKPNIINFNNLLFDHLFKLGLKFKGNDYDPVEVVFQKIPENIDYSSKGTLGKINVDLNYQGEEPLKLSNKSINEYESKAIFADMMMRQKQGEKNFAVLYRNLSPSVTLIDLIMDQQEGLNAQMKLPYSEDPIMGIFRALVEHLYDKKAIKEESKDFIVFLIGSYLKLLNVDVVDLELKLARFYNDLNQLGLLYSFYNFLYGLGVSNSNIENNFSKIRSITGLCHSYDRILKLLDEGSSDKYSIEFQIPQKDFKVVIMTAHASKGLEFENVYLGGIHTNGRSSVNTDTMGKLPGSFTWYKESSTKEKYKTPLFIFERAFEKHKEFSESKRLFYVACSRAESNLFWVDFKLDNCTYTTNQNSWIQGIKHFEANPTKANQEILNVISKQQSHQQFSIADGEEESSIAVPLFHMDNLGVVPYVNNSKFYFLPELSVTRVTSIVHCPRKFYLSNVCKIQNEDLEILGLNDDKDDFIYKRSEIVEEGEELITRKMSASERGTLIHEILSFEILGKKADYTLLNETEKKSIKWTLDLLSSSYPNSQYISEKLLKFPLFGHMISGTPDLVILDRDSGDNAIWDFKTGKRKELTEQTYWFQLYAYAYSQYILGEVSQDHEITLSLVYIDEKNSVDKKVSYDSTLNYMEKYWSKVQSPDEINQEHCESCSFNQLCNSQL